MQKRRYSISFLIVLCFYAGLGLFLVSQQQNITPSTIKKEKSAISFIVLKPKKIAPMKPTIKEPKRVAPPKPKREEPKKIVSAKKEAPKKTIAPKNPKIKNFAKPKEKIYPKVQAQNIAKTKTSTPLVKEKNTPIIQKKEYTKESAVLPKLASIELLDAQKSRFYQRVRELIEENKVYPKIAARRGIQGEVQIRLVLSPSGDLLHFELKEGNKIFEKSLKKTIVALFPLAPPQDLFESNLQLDLRVVFKLI